MAGPCQDIDHVQHMVMQLDLKKALLFEGALKEFCWENYSPKTYDTYVLCLISNGKEQIRPLKTAEPVSLTLLANSKVLLINVKAQRQPSGKMQISKILTVSKYSTLKVSNLSEAASMS